MIGSDRSQCRSTLRVLESVLLRRVDIPMVESAANDQLAGGQIVLQSMLPQIILGIRLSIVFGILRMGESDPRTDMLEERGTCR